MEWPESFYAMRQGEGCPFCGQGRLDETHDGVRFYAGTVADAYLRRTDIQPGLSVVVWRGRHVAEPTELDTDEATAFWLELLAVGRLIERVFAPVKLNYQLLGNSVPHLHAHVIPRFADDPRPGWPFPFPEVEPPPAPEAEYRRRVEALIAAAG